MTLRLHAPLQSALERRGEALRDVRARAERIEENADGFAMHLETEAEAHTALFLDAAVPPQAAERTAAGRALSLGTRAAVCDALQAKLEAATARARTHNSSLTGVEADITRAKNELDAIQSHGAELARSCDRLAKDPLFRELRKSGFSDAEKFPFWRFSAHRQRKEAAVVLARFGEPRGVDTFSALCAVHEANKEALQTLEGEVGRLTRRIAGLEEVAEAASTALHFERAPDEAIAAAWRRAAVHHLEQHPPRTIIATLKRELRVEESDTPLVVLLRQALGARAKARYLKLARAHFVGRTRGDLASLLHDVESTLEVLRHGGEPNVVWPDIARVDADTDDLWKEASASLDRFERIRDVLVSFTAFDSLDDVRPYWDQMIDFDSGDFIDALVMERALAPTVTRASSAVTTWDTAANAAAERLALALAAETPAATPPTDDSDDSGDL